MAHVGFVPRLNLDQEVVLHVLVLQEQRETVRHIQCGEENKRVELRHAKQELLTVMTAETEEQEKQEKKFSQKNDSTH